MGAVSAAVVDRSAHRSSVVGGQVVFFFFQGEGGIRDYKVIGVQTCALPISIAPAVEKAEIERAKRKPTESLDAYALYLRGLARFYQFTDRHANDEALRLFNSAIELDQIGRASCRERG